MGSPSGVRGGAPDANDFSAFCNEKEAFGGIKITFSDTTNILIILLISIHSVNRVFTFQENTSNPPLPLPPTTTKKTSDLHESQESSREGLRRRNVPPRPPPLRSNMNKK